MVQGNWNTNYLQLTIYAPIKLTGTLEGDFIIKITKVRFQHNVSQLYAKAITINCIRWSGPKAIAYNSRFRIFQPELGETLESFRSQNEYDLKQCLLIIKYN